MKEADIQAALDKAQPRAGLTDTQRQSVEDVLKHPGLWLIYDLMLGSMQAQYRVLSHMPLGNTAEVTRAAVIQGTIQGIELFAGTLLEQGVPSQTSTQEQK